MRTSGTLDSFTNTGGASTPEAAAKDLAGSETDVLVAEQRAKRAVAYLLRPDGTAYSELGLVVLDDDTWRVETMDSCSGEEPGLG